MKNITRRNFNNLTAKGIGGAALLSSAPFACAMGVNQKKEKLGIALVGLGSYSTYQLAPALQDTQHCYLAGIVTGNSGKRTNLGRQVWNPEKEYLQLSEF